MEIPNQYYGQLKSRSGLCSKHRINVNAGVIDSDYRGEIQILLSNDSDLPFKINAGDKVAQLLLLPSPNPPIQ